MLKSFKYQTIYLTTIIDSSISISMNVISVLDAYDTQATSDVMMQFTRAKSGAVPNTRPVSIHSVIVMIRNELRTPSDVVNSIQSIPMTINRTSMWEACVCWTHTDQEMDQQC